MYGTEDMSNQARKNRIAYKSMNTVAAYQKASSSNATPDWMAEGNEVKGTYCGFKFQGIVSSVRFAPGGTYHADITLSTPIIVFGEKREIIGMLSSSKEASSVEII
jgi:hypothetical protein